ncbi:MAG: hypothetical protein CL607_28665 [Anaerolineaceae bacterium]|nr:hypothetical protein [Anaerolineaceae bacterium]
MPVITRWHPDIPNVIWIRILGTWTRTDLYQAWERVKELATAADTSVYTITDFSEMGPWPENLLFTHIASMLKDPPENRVLALVVTKQDFLNRGRDFIERLQDNALDSVKNVKSIEEALDIIREHQSQHSRTD